jgi:hypothetical protein
MSGVDEPIPIRAHSLLCLQGFRGRGYSESFVEAMREVKERIDADTTLHVEAIDSPDVFCDACPNLKGGGCTLGGPRHEVHMVAQDREVLRRLGLEAGTVLPWREVLERIASGVRGPDLPGLCTTCPWLHLGWCAEGIEGLRSP